MHDNVFISHAKLDRSLAEQLCRLLEQREISCWMAPRDVPSGAEWDTAIVNAIDAAFAMVVILSANANSSVFVKTEVNRAFATGKSIFTLRTEDILPEPALSLYLARHQWTDGFPAPLDQRVTRMGDALIALMGKATSAQTQQGTRGSVPPVVVPVVLAAPTNTLSLPNARAQNVYTADVILRTGEVLSGSWIWEGSYEPWLTYCRLLAEARDPRMNRITNPKEYFKKIKRIDVLALSDEETRAVNDLHATDRAKVLKANVSLNSGGTLAGVYLLPYALRFSCEERSGFVTREDVMALSFQSIEAQCDACGRLISVTPFRGQPEIICTECGRTQTQKLNGDPLPQGSMPSSEARQEQPPREEPTESDRTELEVVAHDGTSTILCEPSIAYPGGWGPSKTTEGIAVRRGIEKSTLQWSRLRMLRFKSSQEKNDKGTTVWRHVVDATLATGKVIEVELQDDWNMAYMGGGGTGLLGGQTDLGETKIPFSDISVLKILKYARPKSTN